VDRQMEADMELARQLQANLDAETHNAGYAYLGATGSVHLSSTAQPFCCRVHVSGRRCPRPWHLASLLYSGKYSLCSHVGFMPAHLPPSFLRQARWRQQGRQGAAGVCACVTLRNR
jgi:hypothetical protein